MFLNILMFCSRKIIKLFCDSVLKKNSEVASLILKNLEGVFMFFHAYNVP
jgi:hypothetical protein